MARTAHHPLVHSSSPITPRAVVALDITAQSDTATFSDRGIDDLLSRMRDGDRQAAAQFLDRYGQRIRRRVRGKLGSSMRRLFDSLEILSTLGRRLDLFVMSGQLKAASEAQLWSLVFAMADHALIDKARVFRRLLQTEREDSTFAYEMTRRLQQAELDRDSSVELEIERFINALSDSIDRRILAHWLAGERFEDIATLVDLAPSAVRKRWAGIKESLRERLAPDRG